MAKGFPSCFEHPELFHYSVKNSVKFLPVQQKLWEYVRQQSDSIRAGSADEAVFLAFLCDMIGAKRVVEVGVYYGTTTLQLALRLPQDGKIIACDISDQYITEARKYWEEAGVESKVDVRLAPATETMDKMLANGEEGTVDLVFIDADKSSYDAYYEKGLKLLRPGGIVAIDNVHWFGGVLDQERINNDADTKALAMLNDKVNVDARVTSVMLNIADGLTLARKL